MILSGDWSHRWSRWLPADRSGSLRRARSPPPICVSPTSTHPKHLRERVCVSR
ncbi:hypothetical protein HanRHA438_Chr01g0034851 [Helianthus annuus]|nr:hypothetical protein HanIR_Chr01g0037541 [Helianthus annuus]KAJ0949086.1 hypothetical protein HanRHA438_Chr01g0034851 [Helianthus annuus]